MVEPDPYYLEVLPWNHGGTGPRELGPWIARTQDIAQKTRDSYIDRLTKEGYQVTAQQIAGWPGILWWSTKRPWGSDYVFGGWEAYESRKKAKPGLEAREGEDLREFRGLQFSVYRHKRPAKVDDAPLRIIPVHQWCDIRRPTERLQRSAWPQGDRNVLHWIGPGEAKGDDLDEWIMQNNAFVRGHMSKGWIFGAYSYSTCNVPGVVLEWRGLNHRTAATGDNIGNGKMSCLIAAGTSNPDPGSIAFNNYLRLVAELGLGTRTPHNVWNATSCPGPLLTAKIQASNS